MNTPRMRIGVLQEEGTPGSCSAAPLFNRYPIFLSPSTSDFARFPLLELLPPGRDVW